VATYLIILRFSTNDFQLLFLLVPEQLMFPYFTHI